MNRIKTNQKKDNLFQRLLRDIKRNWLLYVMILPVVVWFLIFCYRPMYGVLMAFKDYKVKLGIMGSPWVGLEHFKRFVNIPSFKNLIRNTLTLSIYSLVAGFPIPIIFALLLNYLRQPRLKKTVQMVSYAPFFISTVVICGMIAIFTAQDTGIFNTIRGWFGLESVDFMAKPEWFADIYVWSGIWQGMGWSSIIYISALSGVDYELHEAAIVDGATKVQRIIHVDLPSIKSTIVMLLILQMGSLMGVGFEKVYLLQNPLNTEASSVISTYVYSVGMINSDYGYSTAVGLFNSIINIILLVTANAIVKKLSDESLF